MAVEIRELYRSGEGSESLDNPSHVMIFTVTGTDDDVSVRTIVEATVPSTYLGLTLSDYDFRPLGNQLWEVNVHYGLKKRANETSTSFDTTGGTAHRTQSLQTMGSYAVPGVIAPNFQGAIGVSGDSVEGVDVTIPAFKWQRTKYWLASAVTTAYVLTIADLTGKVNNAIFDGFAADTVLFLGASGSQRGKDDWEITYQFAFSPNVTGLAAGGITGIAKKGWEYLWFLYRDDVDQHSLVKRPYAAYVERLYERGDFSLLGL